MTEDRQKILEEIKKVADIALVIVKLIKSYF
jgi:hypothetical protein